MNNKKNTANDDVGMKRRMAFVITVLSCCFVFLIIVLANISIVNHEKYSSIALNQQLRDTVIAADRGTIYDRNMNILAESAPVWTVAISPNEIKDDEDRNAIADAMVKYLDVEKQFVMDKFQEDTFYSIIKLKVDQPIVDDLREHLSNEGLRGVSFNEDTKRYYPYGNFLAQVLGFVGTDNYGLSGIEAYYDDYLSGVSGRVVSAKNALGSDMDYEYETVHDAQKGNDLILTIDEMIQHYLESALETAVKEHQVKNRASGIIMNVKTGEILAMATKGDFDPNDPFYIFDDAVRAEIEAITDEEQRSAATSQAQQLQWNNKAILELYEPGSVFKAVTASAALETGSATIENTYYCSGAYQVIPSVSIGCAFTEGHGTLDFQGALVHSCNPSFIQMGIDMGSENFYDYFRAFGLTEKTGIDLPGEASSLYYGEDEYGIVQLASSAFGQSNAITPIQMLTAFSAVVNGGYLVTPHVVKEIVDVDGNVVESFGTEVKRQVISAETSEIMTGLLQQVVNLSGGKNAYVAGYRLGGKSGTSQKLGGEEGVYVASFAVVAPTDDPEIACLILLDETDSYSIYGSTLVGPIIASVMSNTLSYLGVEPIYTEEEIQNTDVSVPDVEGRSLSSAYAWLNSVGLSYFVVGEGTSVVRQFPEPWQATPRSSSVILYTEEIAEESIVEVPNVAGMSIADATQTLQTLNLNIKILGPVSDLAVAVAQNYQPETSVPVGTVITVDFVDRQTGDEAIQDDVVEAPLQQDDQTDEPTDDQQIE